MVVFLRGDSGYGRGRGEKGDAQREGEKAPENLHERRRYIRKTNVQFKSAPPRQANKVQRHINYYTYIFSVLFTLTMANTASVRDF